MKNKYLFLFLAAIFALSCTKPEDILDDFQVHVTPEFYSYIIQIEVEDLTDPNAPLPNDLEVEVTGPGSAGVYYTDGTKNFAENSGLVQLFIAREFEPVEGGAPVEFNVVLSANNYRSNSKRFSISYEEFSTEAVAKVMNLNNLPSSVSNTTASGGVDPATNALSQPLNISASTADSTSSTEITIPAGTKFLDADGNVIVGKGGSANLNVSVLSVSDTALSGQASYPGGTGLIQNVGGSSANDRMLLTPSPSFDVSMDLDGVPVAGLDGGKVNGTFETKVYLSAAHNNPATEAPYAVGTTVGVLAYNEESNFWEYQAAASNIQQDPANNKLFVTVNLEKPGPVKIYPDPSGFPMLTLALGRYMIPIDAAATPQKQGRVSFSLNTIRFASGVFTFYPEKRAYWIFKAPAFFVNAYTNNVALSPGASLNGWDVTWEPWVTGLPAGVDVGRSIKAVQENQGVTVSFTLACDGAFISPPAGTVLKFREHDPSDVNCTSTTPYTTLFQFTGENVTRTSNSFTEIEDGKFYDFKAIAAGQFVDTCNVEVIDNHIYNVTPPQSVCNSIGL